LGPPRQICHRGRRKEQQTENKNKSISKTENKSTVCGVFLALQVTLFLTASEDGKRGDEAVTDPYLAASPAAARGSASDGGAWGDAPPLFKGPETFLSTVPADSRRLWIF
jgi:hypothetical protein